MSRDNHVEPSRLHVDGIARMDGRRFWIVLLGPNHTVVDRLLLLPERILENELIPCAAACVHQRATVGDADPLLVRVPGTDVLMYGTLWLLTQGETRKTKRVRLFTSSYPARDERDAAIIRRDEFLVVYRSSDAGLRCG